ncbi:hypothetical protein [Falsiroseomonas sp. HW251]|uniref:hypothetical protein n=1 Tax=Falsiroseomonas sp. HW251 TaxID=3390998 RepID=UPI003D322F3F
MHVFLHIGAQKTGTTTLQHWCGTNRAALAGAGLLYPRLFGSFNHTRLACYAARTAGIGDILRPAKLHAPGALEAFRASAPADFAEEIRASGLDRVLLSNEHLSSRMRRPAEVAAIKALLDEACGPGTRYTIVHYVRRQDELLPSLHSMHVKAGAAAPFTAPANTHHWTLNPLLPLNLWSGVFGAENVVCRVFDRRLLAGGSIVDDLMTIVLPGVTIPAEQLKPVTDRNPRLSPDAAEFLRLLNLAVATPPGQEPLPARNRLVALLEQLPGSSHPPVAPAEEQERIMALYAPVNAEVARRYLGREDGQLFPAREPQAAGTPWTGLTVAEAVRIAGYLWAQAMAEQKSPRQAP